MKAAKPVFFLLRSSILKDKLPWLSLLLRSYFSSLILQESVLQSREDESSENPCLIAKNLPLFIMNVKIKALTVH